MAALITGLGYLGSVLAVRLLDRGTEVVGIENHFSTPRSALDPLRARPGFTYIEGSITQPDDLRRAFGSAPVSTVYHTAAQASADVRAAPPEYTLDTNFGGTLALLRACSEQPVERIVVASSMRLYRTPLPRRVNEQLPLNPTDTVHLSQLFGELLLREYQARESPPWQATIVRLGILYGVSPVMKTDERFLPVPQRFGRRVARGEPLQVATGRETELAFTHVDDAAEAMIACTQLDVPLHLTNVAGEVRSVAEVARYLVRAAHSLGIAVRGELPMEVPRSRARRLESTLDAAGFHSKRRLRDSLAPVIAHYRDVELAARSSER